MNLITRLGEKVLGVFEEIGSCASFTLKTVWWCLSSPMDWDNTAIQMKEIGVRSLPVVTVVSVFIGLILSFMAYAQFSMLGIESLIGPLVAYPMVAQLGPVMAALMVAGRAGSAITAEISTMKVTEQIDALTVIGANPGEYLVKPRFVACILMLPMLTVIADVIGIFGGYLLSVKVYQISEHYYWEHSKARVEAWDITVGLIKAFVFGGLISIICCHRGFNSTGGAEGVGRSTTAAVVECFISIIVFNFFLSALCGLLYSGIMNG